MNNKDMCNREEKILLLLLPYWTPLIPPMGMACIKSYLQEYGYSVKAKDANILNRFREISDSYLKLLGDYIPAGNKGNFENIAGEVFAKHRMACLNYRDETQYTELVEQLVSQSFFYRLQHTQVRQLSKTVAEFYDRLETYLIDLLEQEKPTVLGISVYTATAPASLFAFKLVKEKYSHIKTVMGGGIFCGDLHPGSPNYQFFLEKAPFIDAIIVGEGEQLFLKYLRGELAGPGRIYTLKDLEGRHLDL
ncbi:MAG TPA: cobalamin B12-binding domain-containing protein, partial [Candidatus Kapabacteria bacterium]|nr:cobalamin B12-binding domain-containing protein [Candidatus Kapabacteria bacterium]